MADPPLLALAGIRYHLGDQTILDGVELGIAPGERLSLVGRNGAGKSTLLKILAGEPIADSGTRFAQPGATVATLPQEPDFTGHVIMLEDVGEYMYRIDRYFFHVTSNANVKKCAGIRLGRCSAVPKNDPDFGMNEEEVARFWCEKLGIAYLGRAEIGHDSDNMVVPFS